MKNLLLSLSVALCLANGHAQDAFIFTDLRPMPTARGAIAGAADEKAMYICNGFSSINKFTGIVEKYDVATDSWSLVTSSLIPKQFASAVIISNELYVFNGDLENKKFNKKVEVVDLKTGKVRLSKKNPQPAHAACAVAWNGKIYSFGGKIAHTEPAYSDKLFEFDPIEKKWKELASMPEKKETKGAVVNGKIYTIGGFNGKVSDKIEVYDIITNKWTELLKMPFGISANSLAVYGTMIYTVFDFTNQTLIGCYDVRSNRFTVYKEEKMIGRRHACAQIFGSKLYIVGGNTSQLQTSCLNSLQVSELK